MATVKASYNIRPKSRNLYKNGKKRSLFVRLLMRFFPCTGDSIFEGARKIIFIGAFGSFVYFGGGLLYDVVNEYYQQWRIDQKMGEIFSGQVEISDEDRAKINETKPDIMENYLYYYNQNNDLVGHVLLPDLSKDLAYDDLNRYTINYLVYQTDNNSYYLDHTFDHKPSAGGAIFADFRNRFDGRDLSANTVLFGHNIYSGNYFTKLTRYFQAYEYRDWELTFYKNHPKVIFNSLYEEMEWKVFAVCFFNTEEQYGEVYRYIVPEFSDKDHFNEYILDIMDRSVLFTDVDITYGDNILTLSTCYYPFGNNIDTRVGVFARRVREGEDPEVDTSKATLNTKYLPFDLQARNWGNPWEGRVWDTSKLLSYNEQ
ncbi:MAG: class B sortase [Oscillospiraceae bacterium]|nr:class B sortase [Oscillospiraceae bacterium]